MRIRFTQIQCIIQQGLDNICFTTQQYVSQAADLSLHASLLRESATDRIGDIPVIMYLCARIASRYSFL